MTEQRPVTTDREPDGTGDDTGKLEQPRPRSAPERFFNSDVNRDAVHNGWRPFHVDRFRVVRGRGFPDLVMFRQHPETGSYEMLVAELKRDVDSEFGEGQQEWLEAFKQMGITTKVWRGDSPDDRDELFDILQNGTAGHESVTKLAPEHTSSPIPANFRGVMKNTIESIEGDDLTTGEKASLRRMEINSPDSPIFWELMTPRGMPRNSDIRKWGLIMHGIALMAHGASHAHNPRLRVGRSLYLGGEQQPGDRGFYSEDRLATLLAARGETLHRLLARLFRMLANEGCAFNWHEMAWFILNEGLNNDEEADKSRIEIARAYYQAERRSSQQSEVQGE